MKVFRILFFAAIAAVVGTVRAAPPGSVMNEVEKFIAPLRRDDSFHVVLPGHPALEQEWQAFLKANGAKIVDQYYKKIPRTEHYHVLNGKNLFLMRVTLQKTDPYVFPPETNAIRRNVAKALVDAFAEYKIQAAKADWARSLRIASSDVAGPDVARQRTQSEPDDWGQYLSLGRDDVASSSSGYSHRY